MATTKPISILCVGMEETPALDALAAKGHNVSYDWFVGGSPEVDAYDVIIGPKCWRYLPGVSDKWLPQLLKEARAAQPPRAKKAKVKKAT